MTGIWKLAVPDDELIARLDTLYSMLESEGYYVKANTASFAKDRIEAQVAEIERLNTQCEGLFHAAMNNGQALIIAEDKLAKAVEALERVSNSQPRPKRNGDYDRSDVSTLQRIARTTLAEIKGDKT